MNVLGKLAVVVTSATASAIAAQFATDYWIVKSLDEESALSRVRRFVHNNREVVVSSALVSTAVAYKLFHTKHVCVDDSDETGRFADGTVRVLAEDLMRLLDNNKSAKLAVEDVGEFLITPYVKE